MSNLVRARCGRISSTKFGPNDGRKFCSILRKARRHANYMMEFRDLKGTLVYKRRRFALLQIFCANVANLRVNV